jgi:large subunit ribosomal protein L13
MRGLRPCAEARVGRKVLNWMPTYIPKATSLDRRWFVIDASGKVLGKVATAVATVLTGKRKPTYTPFLDTGDHVVVINADQVVLTGKKETDKLYRHHSGFMGGLKSRMARDVRQEHPARLVEEAVRGMLPKTKLGRAMFLKLKVYPGAKHPHQAQKPQPLNL